MHSTRRLVSVHAALVVFTGVLALPFSLASAQRGGMGGGRGGMGGGMDGGGRGGGGRGYAAAEIRFPSASDIRKFNPAEALADKKKALALSDNQVATLKALQQTIVERNTTLLARYDSAQRRYKPDALPGPFGPTEETQDQIKQLRTLLDSVNVRRLLDVADALAVVTDESARTTAAGILVKQEEEYRARIPQQRGPGRGGIE